MAAYMATANIGTGVLNRALILSAFTTIVCIGLFALHWSFAFAVLPFACAICSDDRINRFLKVFGYFGWITAIRGWGLWNLGYPVASAVSTFAATCRIGISAVLLLFLHAFPGNPLLEPGTPFPGAGLNGILFLLLGVLIAERPRWRMIEFLLLMGNLALSNATRSMPLLARLDLATAPIEDIPATGDYGYNAALAGVMEPNQTCITGENLILSKDAGAIAQWCRRVRALDLTLYLGVQDAETGQGKVRAFNPRTCPDPEIVYAARTGIPGLTGDIRQVNGIQSARLPSFPACFEAFSFWRWIEILRSAPQTIVTFANDHWTEPLPVGRLRCKISAQFEQLLRVPVAHVAETRETLLLQTSAKRSPQ